ncbi:filamentous hemagglutinin N-terminal domain-containing protein [Bradyrhizobium sp.]|uniref:two-partner secretion domain-containing protein n=1 Tax=Bradyrhizobium sp. TaxID=376 RepID=UPI003C2A7E1C
MRERFTIERSLTLAGLMVAMPAAVQAQAVLPQGGGVVSGQASIAAPSANALTITQNSSKAIIEWSGFSVGQGGSVNFIQPNTSSAILNRVTGSTSSTIAGAITGNGQVFLVNPNGIAITSTGTVQVGGGFIASTLDIGNADFNSGNLSFVGKGASASISNAGTISSAPHGFVGLIGGTVSNSGTISVPLGRVGLGSGEQATLDPTGDGFLQVAVPTGAVAADGRALIDVSGRVKAAGGSIEIEAATAQQAVREAVNISGALSARSVSGRSGSIVLDGGAGGNVVVSGKLSATGRRHAGGMIMVTGSNVGLASSARLDGGGTITANSFGFIDSGSYTLGVGTLINPTYTIAFVAPICTVALLHGGLTRGSSPSIPGMSIGPPPTNAGTGALNGLAGAFTKVNIGNYGSAGWSGRAAAPARTNPSLPVAGTKAGSDAGTSAGVLAAAPLPVSVDAPANTPVADASANIAAPLPGLNDFVLPQPNRDAPVEAVNRESAEVAPSPGGLGAAMMIALAATGLVLIAVIAGWLLRGSAWLSGFLASMLLWRRFVKRPRRRDQAEQTPSDPDRVFEDSWEDLQAASLAIELGRGYTDVPGVRQGRRAGIDTSAVI